MPISPRKLKQLGVIGMNDRNINLIAELNPRHLFPLVDNKLRTKLLAAEKGVATPHLLGALKTQHDLRQLTDIVGKHRGFAMKPAKGSSVKSGERMNAMRASGLTPGIGGGEKAGDGLTAATDTCASWLIRTVKLLVYSMSEYCACLASWQNKAERS